MNSCRNGSQNGQGRDRGRGGCLTCQRERDARESTADILTTICTMTYQRICTSGAHNSYAKDVEAESTNHKKHI